MKKILKISAIFLLCACLIVAIAGCGKKEETKSETNTEVADAKTDSVGDNKKEETAEKTKEFSLGSWDGKVYKNDFLGLQYNEPETWSHSSDEEIAKMMNVGKEMLNDDQKATFEASKPNNV